MSSYPAWAPPELVQRAASPADTDPILQRLITVPSMEGVWKVLYKRGMVESARYKDTDRYKMMMPIIPFFSPNAHNYPFDKTPWGLYHWISVINEWRKSNSMLSRSEMQSALSETRAAADKLINLLDRHRFNTAISDEGTMCDFIRWYVDDLSKRNVLHFSPTHRDADVSFFAVRLAQYTRQLFNQPLYNHVAVLTSVILDRDVSSDTVKKCVTEYSNSISQFNIT